MVNFILQIVFRAVLLITLFIYSATHRKNLQQQGQ